MNKRIQITLCLNNERGISMVLVAIMMLMFIGFVALAVDIGNLAVKRNELQNAADAGALAGARLLYLEGQTQVNADANQVAYDAAAANKSQNTAVESNWTGGNSGDIQRGHWSFATRTFTPNASLAMVPLWDVTTAELDANPNFINAVQVTTRRQQTPVVSYFARIFGFESFEAQATAVAYIGFAGTLAPLDVEQPIAICMEALKAAEGQEWTCSIGRFINSGQNVASSETGGWTSFNQDNPCSGGTNSQEVKSLVCGSGNPGPLTLGKPTATNGGEIQAAFNKLIDCWASKTGKTTPWQVVLPVVTCPGNNVSPCETLVGAVTVNIVWITDGGEDPGYDNAPTQMGDWSSSDPIGQNRWNSFVDHFNLKNVDATPAPYDKKSIYFLPDCQPHEPLGRSGGENFGILAQIPVLVN